MTTRVSKVPVEEPAASDPVEHVQPAPVDAVKSHELVGFERGPSPAPEVQTPKPPPPTDGDLRCVRWLNAITS